VPAQIGRGDVQRAQLEEIAEGLEQLSQRLREYAESEAGSLWSGQVDPAYVETLEDTQKRLFALGGELDESVLGPERLADLRGSIIRALAALSESESGPLDALERFLLAMEAARHVLRDALDETPITGGDLRALATYLDTQLVGISQPDKAELAGVSPRQFQRWLKEGQGREPSERLVLAVRLVSLLLRAWSPRGVTAWFRRARPELGDRTPLAALDEHVEDELLWIARRGRAQHGS
jgi:hypothetical protein